MSLRRVASRCYKKLFTPGPLSVTDSVRDAMNQCLGSREPEFINLISGIHSTVLDLAGLDPEEFHCVMMQGSGTYGVESVFQTIVPSDEKIVILSNGAYGRRLVQIADILGLDYVNLDSPEAEGMSIPDIEAVIKSESPAHLAMVHCETSTGMLNPVGEVGSVLRSHNPDATFIVDAMSSFGGVTFDIEECEIDFMITSVNKCIQSVPGASLIVGRRDKFVDHSRTLSLNLVAQQKGFEENGQFRFTPPIECLLALRHALGELIEETIEGREARYQTNFNVLRDGMLEMGYKPYLSEDLSGHIINSFHYPEGPGVNFDFAEFYEFLLADGLYIYPGKVTDADVFRVGTIGDLYSEDLERLLRRIALYKKEFQDA